MTKMTMGYAFCNLVAVSGFLGGLWVAHSVGEAGSAVGAMLAVYLSFCGLVAPLFLYDRLK